MQEIFFFPFLWSSVKNLILKSLLLSAQRNNEYSVLSPLDSGFLEVIKNFVSRLSSFGSLKLARVGIFTEDQ